MRGQSAGRKGGRTGRVTTSVTVGQLSQPSALDCRQGDDSYPHNIVALNDHQPTGTPRTVGRQQDSRLGGYIEG
jgi:hypothetical protein